MGEFVGGLLLVVREVIFRSCDSSVCDTLLSLRLLQHFFFLSRLPFVLLVLIEPKCKSTLSN